jgi:hypothetical protein
MRKLLVTAGAAMVLAAGGLSAEAATMAKAVDAGPVQQNSKAMAAADQDDMGHMSIRQQIQAQLTKTGYTNVTIVPSSFFVRAMDKQGNPVDMVIGPDSFTTVTEVGAKTAAATGPGTAPTMATPAAPAVTPKT